MNEIFFRRFLSEELPTVHLTILTLDIEPFTWHHLADCLMRLHILEARGIEFRLGSFLTQRRTASSRSYLALSGLELVFERIVSRRVVHSVVAIRVFL